MSYILNIADYIYNSICILSNNVYNYFHPVNKVENITNNTINNNIKIPPAISENDLDLSDNSDDETNDNYNDTSINFNYY